MALVALSVVVSAVPAQACVPLGTVAEQGPKTSVRIWRDSDFETSWAVSAGTGTALDPYVIKDLEFHVRGASAVYVSGTTAHFVIRNVTVVEEAEDPSVYRGCCQAGIALSSVSNGSVVGSLVRGTQGGISVTYSAGVRLEGNQLEGTDLEVRGVEGLTMNANRIEGGTFDFEADARSWAVGHTITSSNRVDGYPVLYRSECRGESATGLEVSYAILAGCSGVELTDLQVRHRWGALTVLYSEDVSVRDSTAPVLRIKNADRVFVSNSDLARAQIEAFQDVHISDGGTAPDHTVSFYVANGTGFRLEGNHLVGGEGGTLRLGGTGWPYDCGCFANPPDPSVLGAQILDNHFDGSGRWAVSLGDAPDAVLRGNVMAGVHEGISGGKGSDATVEGNVIEGAGSQYSSGVSMGGGPATITNNRVAGFGTGISLGGGPGVRVTGNAVQAIQAGLAIGDNGGSYVAENAFRGAGIVLDDAFETGGGLQLGPNNTVDGLPIAFHRGCRDVHHDGEALGQVIILRCEGVLLRNLSFNGVWQPIYLSGVSDFRIEDIAIRGVPAGLRVTQSWNGTVARVTVLDVPVGYYEASIRIHAVYNVSIRDNQVDGGFVGLEVDSAELLWITGNALSQPSYGSLSLNNVFDAVLQGNVLVGAGLDLSGQHVDAVGSHDIDESNTVNGRPIVYLAAREEVEVSRPDAGQLIVANVTRVRIANTTFEPGLVNVQVSYAGSVEISAVTAIARSTTGVSISHVGTLRVRDSAFSGTEPHEEFGFTALAVSDFGEADLERLAVEGATGNGLAASSGTRLHIGSSRLAGNWTSASLARLGEATVENSSFAGELDVGDSEGVSVRGSDFSGASGVHLTRIQGAVVEGNRVHGVQYTGIGVQDSTSVTVRANEVAGAATGIALAGKTNDIEVVGNSIVSNGHGLWMYGGREGGVVSIHDNTLEGNGVGFSGNATDGTTVFHNRFVNNTLHAQVGPTGAFDAGYLVGGNYWSDYPGPDDCSGPAQDECTGPDGYGDEPVCLPGYGNAARAVDHYPLVDPAIPPAKEPWTVEPVLSAPGGSGGSIEAAAPLIALLLLVVVGGLGAAIALSRRRPSQDGEADP